MASDDETTKYLLGGAMVVAGFPVVLLVMTIPTCLVNGLVVMKLWQWFVVEPFGVPAVGYFQAMGLTLLAGYINRHTPPKESAGWETVVLMSYVFPFVTLGIGYLIHLLAR